MGSGAALTFPKTGRSTDPQVSAPQWTSPEAKSAVRIPATENREETKLKERVGNRSLAAAGAGAEPLTDAQQDEPQMSQVKVGK